jgi:hypothetical protein
MKSVAIAALLMASPAFVAQEAERPEGSMHCAVEETLRAGGSIDDAMSCEDWFPMYVDVTVVSPDGTEAFLDSRYVFTWEDCQRGVASAEENHDFRYPPFSTITAVCRNANPDQDLEEEAD